MVALVQLPCRSGWPSGVRGMLPDFPAGLATAGFCPAVAREDCGAEADVAPEDCGAEAEAMWKEVHSLGRGLVEGARHLRRRGTPARVSGRDPKRDGIAR